MNKMKKRLLLTAILLISTDAYASSCDDAGLYAFALLNCPQSQLGVNIRIPLCEQPQWQHLAWMDYRCYKEVDFDWKRSCNQWDCPVPYEHILVEPISGKTRTLPLNVVEMDQHYRSVRQALGQLIPKKRRNR